MRDTMNFMLEHLKLGQKKSAAAASSSVEVPSVQCETENGRVDGEPNANSEKSPISALIQKFSGSSSTPSSSSASGVACAGPTGGPIVDPTNTVGHNDRNNNISTKSLNSDKVNVNDTNSFRMSTLPQKSESRGGDEVDCSSAAIRSQSGCPALSATSEPVIVLRRNSGKVNNSTSNKLSVHSSHPEDSSSQAGAAVVGLSWSPRKKSDAGLQRGLLATTEDKNGIPATTRVASNGHIINSVRKLSADFRLNHRDLLNEDGKQFGHKPVRVKNLADRTEAYDMLHNKTIEKVSE